MSGGAHPPGSAGEVSDRLRRLEADGLHRRMRRVSGRQGTHVELDGRDVLLLCSNNYLGLADDERVREAAAAAALELGASASASRLVSGNMDIHEQLEAELADFHKTGSALVFGSGYLANIGTIGALAPRGSVVYSDELNHASIVDGCRLSGASKFIYRHADLDHLAWAIERSPSSGGLIVSDGLFSMDGDTAPLEGLAELARRHGMRLMIDDSHAVGTVGPGGRGTAAEAGVADEVDVIVGTLGKALASYGAYVACDRDLRELLVNSARSLIFSTGLPPSALAAARTALGIVVAEPDRRQQLARAAETVREELASAGLVAGGGGSQIIPVEIGDPAVAMAACEAALEQGVYAQAIRPPTVPDGTSRLRLTVMATHDHDELRTAARVIAEATLAARESLEPAKEAGEVVAEPEPGEIAIRWVGDPEPAESPLGL